MVRSPLASSRLINLLTGVQALVLMVVLFAPIAWMALASFKNRVDITRYPPKLLFEPTLDNYRK